jgi:hypothetical protein
MVKVVGALGVFFFFTPDDAAVGLDLGVRIKRSLAIAPRAVFDFDVLVQREFGLSHANLLVLNTGKLTSWRFLRKRF